MFCFIIHSSLLFAGPYWTVCLQDNHLMQPLSQLSSILCHQLFALTNDDAADGAGLLDVSGLLCKHTLSPLKQSNVALDVLRVGDLSAATVGFSHSHEATYLQPGAVNCCTERKKTFKVLTV